MDYDFYFQVVIIGLTICVCMSIAKWNTSQESMTFLRLSSFSSSGDKVDPVKRVFEFPSKYVSSVEDCYEYLKKLKITKKTLTDKKCNE